MVENAAEKNQPQESHELIDLVRQAEERFQSQRFKRNEYGLLDPYGIYWAVADLFEELGIGGHELTIRLTKQTSLTPNEADIESLIDAKNWDEFFSNIGQRIVAAELDNLPGIREEWDRRCEELSSPNFNR